MDVKSMLGGQLSNMMIAFSPSSAGTLKEKLNLASPSSHEIVERDDDDHKS